MDKIIQFLSESNNFALLLSSCVSICVSIVSAVVSVMQSRKQYREKSMELYFEAQYNAYTDFFKAATEADRELKNGESRDTRVLIAAAKNAELLSPYHVAKIIDDFCAVYMDYLSEEDKGNLSEKTEEEFKFSLEMVTIYLREELLRYDFHNKRNKRKRKQLKKLYNKHHIKE